MTMVAESTWQGQTGAGAVQAGLEQEKDLCAKQGTAPRGHEQNCTTRLAPFLFARGSVAFQT